MKGSYINKNNYDNNLIDNIRNDLYACPFFNSDYGEIITYPMFRESNNHIYLPRFYKNNNIKIKHKYLLGEKSDMKFIKKLREEQIDIANTCIDQIQKNGGGIINLPCGYGKTVIALYIACMLGIKTLVIVHKTFLQDQWIERVKEFTDARVGLIRQKTIDVKNKDIVIGMLQSVSMINYNDDIFNNFGIVIYDEAHHIISKVFSNALFKINSRYIIGLTATPTRSGNLTKCLNLHLGDIIYKIDKKSNENAIVKIFNYEIKHKLFTEKKMWIRGKVQPNTPKMINNLCNIDGRNKLLVDIIYHLWNIEDRKILVLSGRTSKIKHLEILKKILDKKISDEIENGTLLDNECLSYYYTGNTSQLERKDAEKYADIIFATYEMAHEGLDISRLNTVILTTPKSSIQQAIGRIMRKASHEILILPLIIDIKDELSLFPKQFEKREKIYKKYNYKIENFYINNDKLITNKDYLKNKYNYTDDELNNEFDHNKQDYEPDLKKILLTQSVM